MVNGSTTVAAELQAKVQHAVGELGYRPNLSARALVTRRTDTVALVAVEPVDRVFGDPYFSGIVRGATVEVGAAGLALVLLMAQSPDDLARIERYLQSGTVDGVLLISQHADYDPLPRALVDAGMPLVIGGRPMRSTPLVPYVDNDNVHGARIATRRLMGRGCRRIGTACGPLDMVAGVDRLEGYRQELGDTFDDRLVENGDFTQKGGAVATERLLHTAPDLDAIFAASDLMALGALQALRRAGRRVPEDVALIGYDDIEVAATASPPLTTVRQHTALQGRAMVRLLLAQIRPDLELAPVDGIPDAEGAEYILLPVELVVRESA